MSVSLRLSVISRLAGAAAVVWMYGAGPAWSGDGGDSLGTIQAIIGPATGASGFCSLLGIGVKSNFLGSGGSLTSSPCPQLPTVTQAVLEASALGLSPPEMVAAQNSIPAGSNVNASNPAVVPQGPFVPTPFPLTSATSPKLFDLLLTLTSLPFISAKSSNRAAAVTQLYNANADTFLYGVTVSANFGFATPPGGTVPDTLYLFYDDLSRNANFSRGQTVAKFLLPLTVLNSDGTERAVPATLQFIAPTTDCSASTVNGDFLNKGKSQTVPATQLGLNCAVVFDKSPTSNENHAIFEVSIPLLVTGATCFISTPPTPCAPPSTDPAYFYSSSLNPGQAGPINIGLFTAFILDDLGTTPTTPNVLPPGASIGIAPAAGPFCTVITCPPPPALPPPPGSIHFALCANLPKNNGNAPLVPSVGAYYAIATSGETLLSAALPGVSTSVCPQL